MAEWIHPFDSTSQADVEQFERSAGVLLPPLYKNFLLTTNGGYPCEDMAFNVPEIPTDKCKVMLGALYGIGEEDQNLDLLTEYEELKDVIPKGFIPIGTDPGGNQLLLATEGPHMEVIFFWDRVGILTTPEGKNLFLIAQNINEFLATLHVVLD